ncbi:hypothetical protein F3Y22_tig00001478pilonHSYRG00402 [Hibiscus syriacus]|uniref:Uncharacterized protein n=1 Tax=Hibiscus syriacus TaxID=106335 RepID=A0A6A3D1C5_HIBSY|nr:hypothetical protein F3Y22_tig00001478pilonHSYRG00402 [Hibiscus syriacus]
METPGEPAETINPNCASCSVLLHSLRRIQRRRPVPIGQFMAAVLPTTQFELPGIGSRKFSLNPGPFNMKEHVLISIFSNAGAAFGSGSAYAVGIVTIIKAFYNRKISFLAGWLLIITTQAKVSRY